MFGMLSPLGGGDDIPLKKKEIIVGRKEDCDVVLRFKNVSGKHCRLVLSDGYWYALDLNSSNGVKINGLRTMDRRVDPGAKIFFADHAYIMQYDPQKNGAVGALPPDMLETDVFSKSLLERVGLSKGSKKPPTATHEKVKGKSKDGEIDYGSLTPDDVEFF